MSAAVEEIKETSERVRGGSFRLELAGDEMINERETAHGHSLWCWGCVECFDPILDAEI